MAEITGTDSLAAWRSAVNHIRGMRGEAFNLIVTVEQPTVLAPTWITDYDPQTVLNGADNIRDVVNTIFPYKLAHRSATRDALYRSYMRAYERGRHLRRNRQIDLVNAPIIVSLGSAALYATSLIEPHGLNLRDHVRTAHRWYKRLLIPVYHPGQRAMLHRSFANQLSDYQFVAERVRRLATLPRSVAGSAALSTVAVVDLITRLKPTISYFALHKLFYLVEVQSVSRLGRRLTDAFIIRQKDGPYCTELHPLKLKKAIPNLKIINKNGVVFIERGEVDLFNSSANNFLNKESTEVVEATVARYGDIPNSRLKAVAYLTGPMRAILRQERNGRNMFKCANRFFRFGSGISKVVHPRFSAPPCPYPLRLATRCDSE